MLKFISLISFLVCTVASASSAPELLKKAYSQRVTGYSLRGAELAKLYPLSEDQFFAKLFENVGFNNYRLPVLVSRFSNEAGDPFQDGDDFQVAMALAIQSDMDIRDIFVHNFSLKDQKGEIKATGDFAQYQESMSFSFGQQLARTKLELTGDENYPTTGTQNKRSYQGLLTTQGFGSRYLSGGTNRRAVRAIWNNMLCSPIDEWRDASLDHYYIGHDITITPSGDSEKFMNYCASCHAGIDAQRGWSAYLNFNSNMGDVEYLKEVSEKFKNHSPNNPEAPYITADDSWVNPYTSQEYQKRYGWRWPVSEDGDLKGKGVLQYASMIVNSMAFQRCMTKNLLVTFCDLTKDDSRNLQGNAEFEALSNTLRTRGYKIKTFLKDLVKSGICLNRK